MIIKAFSDTIILPDLRDLLRVHLYLKLIQYGIKPFENDIDIILELYLFGGYHTSEEQNKFIDLCITKELKGSAQSLRNLLSKYVRLGVFEKPKNSVLYLKEQYIPKVECDKIVLTHKITHAK